jgi:hypothetical protein
MIFRESRNKFTVILKFLFIGPTKKIRPNNSLILSISIVYSITCFGPRTDNPQAVLVLAVRHVQQCDVGVVQKILLGRYCVRITDNCAEEPRISTLTTVSKTQLSLYGALTDIQT